MNQLSPYSYGGVPRQGGCTALQPYSFVKDYQGNVRQVVNERGGVVQESDYYPYGMLFGESDVSGDRSEANRYRYGGKEYLAGAGLNLYDFTARYLDPAMGAFLSSDPMQGDYKPLSPTLYCGADPVNRVDPSGRIIEFIGDDDNIEKIKQAIESLRRNKLFNALYTSLESSSNKFTIGYSDSQSNHLGEFKISENNDGDSTIFRNTSNSVILEEFFHMFQFDNKDAYGEILNDYCNREYEARFFVETISQTTNLDINENQITWCKYPYDTKTGKLVSSFIEEKTYRLQKNHIKILNSIVFNSFYMYYANMYALAYYNNPIANNHYRQPTFMGPRAFIRLIYMLKKHTAGAR